MFAWTLEEQKEITKNYYENFANETQMVVVRHYQNARTPVQQHYMQITEKSGKLSSSLEKQLFTKDSASKVHMTIAPRFHEKGKYPHHRESNIRSFQQIVVDIDGINHNKINQNTIEKIVELVNANGKVPLDFAISSGRGVQLIYKFEQLNETSRYKGLYDTAVKYLCSEIHMILAEHGLGALGIDKLGYNSLMRMPGTYNPGGNCYAAICWENEEKIDKTFQDILQLLGIKDDSLTDEQFQKMIEERKNNKKRNKKKKTGNRNGNIEVELGEEENKGKKKKRYMGNTDHFWEHMKFFWKINVQQIETGKRNKTLYAVAYNGFCAATEKSDVRPYVFYLNSMLQTPLATSEIERILNNAEQAYHNTLQSRGKAFPFGLASQVVNLGYERKKMKGYEMYLEKSCVTEKEKKNRKHELNVKQAQKEKAERQKKKNQLMMQVFNLYTKEKLTYRKIRELTGLAFETIRKYIVIMMHIVSNRQTNTHDNRSRLMKHPERITENIQFSQTQNDIIWLNGGNETVDDQIRKVLVNESEYLFTSQDRTTDDVNFIIVSSIKKLRKK